MHVKRFADAKATRLPIIAAAYRLRLFGAEAGGTQSLIVGLSHFLPGGGAGPDASPPEKVYFVLAASSPSSSAARRPCLKRTIPASSARTKIARSSIAATRSAPSWSPWHRWK